MPNCSERDVLYTPLSIAPMIDWTNVHFRMLMRLLAPDALVYTEMVTVGAILHNPERALATHPVEHPVALQLGGADPESLARAARMAEARGFDEINLNLGCPSDKVQSGQFGACLMRDPGRVVECITALREAVSVPVTAKTRIGIDNDDSFEFFHGFVEMLVHAGIRKLIVHARKAWLHGLNPKQNRTIPPLHPEYVYKIKTLYPEMPVVINGNITTADAMREHLAHVEGVMIGRLACDNPWAIAAMQASLKPGYVPPTRAQIAEWYAEYLCESHCQGVSPGILLKPIMNLAHSMPGAKRWKGALMAMQQTGNLAGLHDAIQLLESESLLM